MDNTREKLIDIINAFFGCDAAYFDVNPFDLATHLISHGVTFATDNNVGSKWIPVTERLPEETTDVLTYRKGGILVESLCNGIWGDDDEEFVLFQVTHWMPLPEPPKEVEQ